jgi:carboxymethylenebutenolidase
MTTFGQSAGLPPAEADSKARLVSSPRHGEWTTVAAGHGDKVDAWVVYPERADKAPVVLVVHEIFSLTDWVRAATDQLAAEGFIAIAADLLSGKAPGGKGSSAADPDAARALIAGLDPAEIVRRLNAVARFAIALPAALPRFAVVGFCWGGGVSFAYAAQQPGLSAAVVFYGTPPASPALSRIQAPVLGLFGGNDERVDATVPSAAAEMKRLGKPFEYGMFSGAGHAFMRVQSAEAGANLKAAQQGWPMAVSFLKKSLQSGTSRLSPAYVEMSLLQTTTCGHQSARRRS